MVNVTPNPDSTVVHIETDSGKPTKVFYNWLQNITRIIGGFGDIVTHDASEFAPASGTAPACFSVHKNGTNQSIPHATTTQVTWSTEVYDVGGFFASNVWTPPAGKIFLHAATELTVSAAGFQKAPVIALFRKNGTEIKRFSVYVHSNAFAATTVANIGSMEDVANGTDTYDIAMNALSNDASNLTLSGTAALTYFMGHWISA